MEQLLVSASTGYCWSVDCAVYVAGVFILLQWHTTLGPRLINYLCNVFVTQDIYNYIN